MASLFLFSNLGFVLGIAFASWPLPLYLGLPIFFIKKIWFKRLFFLLLFISLGSYRYHSYKTENSLEKYFQKTATVVGYISEEIDPGGDYQKITLKTNTINGKKSEEKILLSLSKYPEYSYGDILEVTGKMEAPENWSDFRYDRYLARYDIYALIAFPKVKKIGRVNNLFGSILNFKKRIYKAINRALPEPEAGLANAILLGYKGTLDSEEKSAFSCCGLSHVIAISGSHLTLLSALSFQFLAWFGIGKRKSFIPVASFIWLYALFTGFQASAVRSVIMGSLVLWGEQKGKSYDGGILLLFSASLMLSINPLLLRDDLGFQLSFLAMIALIYVFPLGEKIFGKGNVRSVLILTLASQLLTWPISSYNFGTFSVIAPLANILVVWIFAWLLPALLIASTLSLLFPFLNVILFSPAYLMSHYVVLISDWLAVWPKACLDLKISWQLMVGYYVILFLIYLIIKKERSR